MPLKPKKPGKPAGPRRIGWFGKAWRAVFRKGPAKILMTAADRDQLAAIMKRTRVAFNRRNPGASEAEVHEALRIAKDAWEAYDRPGEDIFFDKHKSR